LGKGNYGRICVSNLFDTLEVKKGYEDIVVDFFEMISKNKDERNKMGWDCYAYTFIGVRIPQKILWEKKILKKCDCYEEDPVEEYCQSCSGEDIMFSSGLKCEYGYDIIKNERSKEYLYICINKEYHNCRDEEDVQWCEMSLEDLIPQREALNASLIEDGLMTEKEFGNFFRIYTRANYDY
jgi:predicted phage-related endonuclease